MSDTGRAIALTVGSASLRRAQLSSAVIWTAEWAVMVTLGVVAFHDGGSVAVGVVTALRLLPAALLAPFAAVVADAVRRDRVLACVGVTRAATLAAAAAVLALDGPLATVYALMMLATIAQALHRPAHSALLPALCASPHELTGANVVRGLLDALATLAGPLAAALGLAVSEPAVVFAGCAACSLWAGILVVGLPYEAPPRSAPRPISARASLCGLQAIAADRGLLLITGRTQRHVGHRRHPPAGNRPSAGAAEVLRDGHIVETLQRGDCFGEIALLRGSARSATVRASATTTLDVAILSRDRFLTAVTGQSASAAVAEQAVASRLRALNRIPGTAAVAPR